MDIVFPARISLQPGDGMPNNPALPVLVYRKVFTAQTADKHKLFQQGFENNGWKGVWKNGLYDYHHFHSSSHEALGIAGGTAEILLGGEGGKAITLEAGDLVVLPAGTGHKRLAASENLVVIGAYPAGQENYDVCRSKGERVEDLVATIAAVPLPDTDPLYGEGGPLLEAWKRLR